MNEEELLARVEAVRHCPFECGWKANRSLKNSLLCSALGKLPAFIERCQADIADHLVAAHSADREHIELRIRRLLERVDRTGRGA